MSTRQRKNLLFAGFFLCTVLFPPIKLLAAPFYEGKTIKIIIGSAPGGGHDRMARLLAKHLPKYIPGKPSLIVENMPGAQNMIAANYHYNIAKPDGLTIGNFDGGLLFAQLLKGEGVRFDMTKYSWIGSAAAEASVLTFRTDLPYKTVDDLRQAKQPIHIAAQGPATMSYQFPFLLKEFLGLNFNMLNYQSGGESTLALERKEADGYAAYYGSAKPLIERGLVRPVIRGRISEPGIENLPVDEDLTKDLKGKTIMAIRSAGGQIARPYVAAPGTPADIMTILRDAFAKVLKDPDLVQESKKLMMTVGYVPADECLKVINYVLNQPEDMVKEFGKYIKF